MIISRRCFQVALRPVRGAWAWLVCAVVLGVTPVAWGQISITNGCFVVSYLLDRTNVVCAPGWVLDDYAVSVSNRCVGGTTSEVVMQCDRPLGMALPVGINFVSCRVANGAATLANCHFQITVESVLPPAVVSLQTNLVVIAPCASNCVPVEYSLPEVTNGALVECVPPPGACLPVGYREVKCKATNDCGSAYYGYFYITVERELPLSIPLPAWIVLTNTCESNCLTVTYPPPVVINGTLASCTPPSGSCFPIGNTPVSCRATNDCGDFRGTGFSVIIIPVLPVIQCPPGFFAGEVRCPADCKVANYPLPAVTNGTLASCTPPPGTCIPVGITVVTCRATNLCGASAQCQFNVHSNLRDSRQTPGFRPDFSGGAALISCGSACVPMYYNPPVDQGDFLGCNPPSGTCFPVGQTRVFCTAQDWCSTNLWRTSFLVTVYPHPVNGPVISPASTFTVTNCTTNCMPVTYPLPTASSASEASIRCTPPPGTCFPRGVTTVTCVASNACSLSMPVSFSVNVMYSATNAPVLHIETRNGGRFLQWDNRCPGIARLQTASEPDGPWETIPDALPGYAVTPSEHRQYFRVKVE